MSEQRPSDVLGALPRRRPHRRSAKRPAAKPSGSAAAAEAPPARRPRGARPKAPAPSAPAASAPARATARRSPRLRQPAQPAGVPATPAGRRTEPPTGGHILGMAAQAAAELAEIGLSVSARALRRVVDRLPRP